MSLWHCTSQRQADGMGSSPRVVMVANGISATAAWRWDWEFCECRECRNAVDDIEERDFNGFCRSVDTHCEQRLNALLNDWAIANPTIVTGVIPPRVELGSFFREHYFGRTPPARPPQPHIVIGLNLGFAVHGWVDNCPQERNRAIRQTRAWGDQE